MGRAIGRRGLLQGAALASCAAALDGIAAMPAGAVTRTGASPRTVVALDRGWRFHLGHASDPARDFGFGTSHDTYGKSGDVGSPAATAEFDDKGWEAVDLPHDWAVALPFARSGAPDSETDKVGAYQGYKPVGRLWPATSVGWYRRALAIDAADAGRRLSLEFDGVSRDCLVMLNGFVVGSNESGYAPFRTDITDFAKPGEPNILVLRCDVSLGEAWSYARGREVPTASNLVRFTLSGDARLLGVGNGDPRSLEPDRVTERSAFNGLCMALVQAGDGGGAIRMVAEADGLKPAMLPIATRS